MYEIEYIAGNGRDSLGLDGDLAFVGTADGLHESAWSYTVDYRSLSGVSRKARETTLELSTISDVAMDEYRRVFDRDMALGTPGTIVYRGEWSQRAYVTKVSVGKITEGRIKQVTLTVVLLDGVWIREHTTAFNLQVLSTGTNLDYPYDYPHDYTRMSLSGEITQPGYLPASVKIIIYGPVVNPYLILGDNKYQLNNITVPSGGYLIVDGRTKTIMMTAENGDTTNVFSSGERGNGQGSGSYIFEKLPPGVSSVSWPNSFGFDVTMFEEEAAPPWSISSSPQ